MTVLTSRQRAFLRARACDLSATLQIGKGGFTAVSTIDLDQQLAAHELVKIHILKNVSEEPRTIAEQAAARSGAAVVQVVGRKAVLYRRSAKQAQAGRSIQLPAPADR